MCECYANFLRIEFGSVFNARFGSQSHSHVELRSHQLRRTLGSSRSRSTTLMPTISADVLPLFGTSSYSTICPSFRLLSPALSTAEIWTNTSFPPPPCG